MVGEKWTWLRSEGVRRLALVATALWVLLWASVFATTSVYLANLHHELETEIVAASHPAVPEDAEIAQQALAALQAEIDADRPWLFISLFVGLGLPIASIAVAFAASWVMQGFKHDQKPPLSDGTGFQSKDQMFQPRGPNSRPNFRGDRSPPGPPLRH